MVDPSVLQDKRICAVVAYGLFGDPCECLLSVLHNKRRHDELDKSVVPFVLNVFADQTDEGFLKSYQLLMTYVGVIQDMLYDRLLELGFPQPRIKYIPRRRAAADGFSAILERHKALLAMQGVRGEYLVKGPIDLTKPIEFPEDDIRSIERHFQAFVLARNALIKVRQSSNLGNRTDTPVMRIVTTQILSFFTHYCRAVLLSLQVDPKGQRQAEEEVGKGISHLTRVVLDMHKVFMGVYMQAVGCNQKVAQIRRIIQMRYDQLMIFRQDKMQLFDEMEKLSTELLAEHGIRFGI